MPHQDCISLKKVRVHNLKSVCVDLPTNKLIVFSGVSGSGKSSLAFDTLYVEGQRRYVTSLSSFARKFLGDLSKPDMESASGISPTIAIEQKTIGRNPRSTVGTITEIHDYLRVLFARLATPYCPVSLEPVQPQSKEQILEKISSLKSGLKFLILAPFARNKKASFKEEFQELLKKGFTRIRLDTQIIDLNEEIQINAKQAHDVDIVIDRLAMKKENLSRITESTLLALEMGEGSCIVLTHPQNEEFFFSLHGFSPKSGLSYPPLEPQDFSFNSPIGMCSCCNGLGQATSFDLEQIIDEEKSIAQDCCLIATSYQTIRYQNIYNNLARIYKFDINTPWKKLSKSVKNVFLYGSNKKWLKMTFKHPKKPMTWTDYVKWNGVVDEALKKYREAKSEKGKQKYKQYLCEQLCPQCQGSRIKPYPRIAKIEEKTIQDVSSMTIYESKVFFSSLSFSKSNSHIGNELSKEILQRLDFLLDVGLDYLSLDRSGASLSGGEAQRVRLAAQIGCGLVGVTYVLDEPSIGLHHKDNKSLINTLKKLRNRGNNVIVVEHDEETILEADYVVDFGPRAGLEGGEITFCGETQKLLESKDSLTGKYLSGKLSIPIPKKRNKSSDFLEIKKASHNNLKSISLKIPLGNFVVITGVSGSGKSSLVTDIIYPSLSNELMGSQLPVGSCQKISCNKLLEKIISVDQSPIGKNPRSTPATYVKLWDEIRLLFSKTPISQSKGYTPGRFSFNVQEGSCLNCSGMGMVKVDMDFLEDIWTSCEACFGKRFDSETLMVHYRGKTIYDILEMTIKEAYSFFSSHPKIQSKLQTLCDVGLDYLKLGQSSTTLSGGESQRIKLAKELSRPCNGKTLYLLDEPSVGLHSHDIHCLLNVLYKLIQRGNSIVIIEHNLDIIKCADWIIDLGPEGGSSGGEIVAKGTPEQISKKNTYTGKALKELFLKTSNKTSLSKKRPSSKVKDICIEGGCEHNLKNITLTLPRDQMIAICGPSGSGKSSLAFDTIYAEGQRRYTETLSPYARQFVRQMPKPKFEDIQGLSPCIAIEQKSHSGNPRSTIGTMTEVYDYLRLLYARLGIAHCPETKEVIKAISKEHIVEKILHCKEGERLHILAPLNIKTFDEFVISMGKFQQLGFLRILLNGDIYELSEEIPFSPKRKNALFLVIDRIKTSSSMKERILESVSCASSISSGRVAVMREENDIDLYNLNFSVPSTGKTYPEITPHSFSFNIPQGMCLECQGIGSIDGVCLPIDTHLKHISLKSFFSYLFKKKTISKNVIFPKFLDKIKLDIEQEISSLTLKQSNQLFLGKSLPKEFQHKNVKIQWRGLYPLLSLCGKSSHYKTREALKPILKEIPCPSCNGERLNPLARHVTLKGKSLPHLCSLPIKQLLDFIKKLSLTPQEKLLLEEVYKQITTRLKFICDLGIDYLSLNRKAPTLSGGENQRIRLARQLGSGLTGVLYILDEPTIGLHPQDCQQLLSALKDLKNLGNSLICVEHDPMVLKTCDYLVDLGPGSGKWGGEIIEKGSFKQLLNKSTSPTIKYLTHQIRVEQLPPPKSPAYGKIHIKDVNIHNLLNLQVSIPLGHITCITGVSGSGKSTLLRHVLKPSLGELTSQEDLSSFSIHEGEVSLDSPTTPKDLVVLEQKPIGRTARSNVATYVDLLTPIREWFSLLPKAKAKGLLPRHFSYNHKKGMCSTCWGLGYKKIQLHFLPDAITPCDQCHGLRLNPTSLSITYEGKSLGQYLQMTIEEIEPIFSHIPSIKRLCELLKNVGLGYLNLGQEVATLSGGEAQRLRLCQKLMKRSSGKSIYLLDEPTCGLHFSDIEKLLKVLLKLREQQHTVIIVEHNMDIIKSADYIIDLGPGAGKKGGKVVFEGDYSKFSKAKTSTAKFLKSHLTV
jgi:excinuclease ABC subunit A